MLSKLYLNSGISVKPNPNIKSVSLTANCYANFNSIFLHAYNMTE